MIKVEMETSISSASNFIDDNGINRRWGSMEKYTEMIKKIKNEETIGIFIIRIIT